MTQDYGVQKPRKKPPLLWLVGIGLVVLIPASFVPKWLEQRNANVAQAQEWTVPGEPCAVVDKVAYDTAKLPKPKITEYEGVRIERRLGHMECVMLHADGGRASKTYPVCRFTSPYMLGVTVDGASTYFAPPAGKSAQIAVENGQPTCQVIGKLKFF
ncbi:hypothetical protein [Caulobacter sp. NIBR2454]|uniref:hypothetical protein n=1 Tax=Caulobacter sp. NIBR2454 TaxID=3015996 RepID=UPI0022B64FD6|nr:hypothetical protein [Caulobacter sp. NIBR2454]